MGQKNHFFMGGAFGTIFGMAAMGIAASYWSSESPQKAEPAPFFKPQLVETIIANEKARATPFMELKALSGSASSASVDDKTKLTKISGLCQVLNAHQYLDIRLESDADKIARRQNQIDASATLPLTATDDEEKAAFSFLDDEDRAKVLEETSDLKTLLHDAASSIFSAYDARRFFVAENRDDADTLNKALTILRKNVFTGIAPQPSGGTQRPGIFDDADKVQTLTDFASKLVDALGDDYKPEEIAVFFRNYIKADLNYSSSGPDTEIDFYTKRQVDDIVQHQTDTEQMNNDLKSLFLTAVHSLEEGNKVPYRITFATGERCQPN